MANDNAAQTTDELPADGPWNMDGAKLSQAVGNTSAPVADQGNGALVPDIDAPWALTGEQLSKWTNNVKPVPPTPKPVDPSTQNSSPDWTVSGVFNSIFGKLINTETGGKHTDKNGNLITSPKGAEGITQVMPKTGDSPGFGVTPLQNNSKEEYLRFGKDYLQAMVKYFNGDIQKAVAAYNAGPGTVQKLSQKYGSDWQQGLPKETSNYVRKILG